MENENKKPITPDVDTPPDPSVAENLGISDSASVEISKITIDPTKTITTKGDVGLKREDTRSEIARYYVKGFLWIIAIAMVGGGILNYVGKITFENLTALLVTLSGILSGALGFVIGYYFKSGE